MQFSTVILAHVPLPEVINLKPTTLRGGKIQLSTVLLQDPLPTQGLLRSKTTTFGELNRISTVILKHLTIPETIQLKPTTYLFKMIRLSLALLDHLPILAAIRRKPATSQGRKIRHVLGTATVRHLDSITPVCLIRSKVLSLIYKVLRRLILASRDVTSGLILAKDENSSLMHLAVA